MIALLVVAARPCLCDPAAILAANERASRSEQPAPATVISVYDIIDSGLKGREMRTVDTVTRNFTEHSDIGPILSGGGFDGSGWTRESHPCHSIGSSPSDASFDPVAQFLTSIREDATFENRTETLYCAYHRRSGMV